MLGDRSSRGPARAPGAAPDGDGFVLRPRRPPRDPGRARSSRGDDATALALLAAALDAASPAAVFIDVPAQRSARSPTCSRARGFARQRPFVRMALGATPPPRSRAALFALAGPEFG